MLKLLLLMLGLALGACAAPAGSYEVASAAAERDYAAGRYQSSGDHWRQAARHAKTERDRQEATYRAAASYRRAGAWKHAEELLTTLARDNSADRSDRAAYDLALLHIEREKRELAHRELLELMKERPESVFAERAFIRCLRHLQDQEGRASALEWLEQLARTRRLGELGELVAHTLAKALYEEGKLVRARDTWLDVAERFPYPEGALWDDALFYAARAERRLGRFDEAVALLRRLLANRETAHLTGSYERQRYAEGRFLIAEIYRDDLNQPERALATFRDVFEQHSTSLLRDDALWQEALLRARLEMDACPPLRLLLDEIPNSRFAGCAAELCPQLATRTPGSCRDYLKRELPR